MSLRSIFKGWVGEVQTSLGQHFFLDPKVYVSINNITLSGSNGTTQIDHVIVSRFGIFVVETKNMEGWIYGSEKDSHLISGLKISLGKSFGSKIRCVVFIDI